MRRCFSMLSASRSSCPAMASSGTANFFLHSVIRAPSSFCFARTVSSDSFFFPYPATRFKQANDFMLRNCKTTVLITSLPRETVGASLVVKAYFDRWPHEELQFRSMKSFACLNRVAGYGKKKLSDETVRAKQKELGARITEWRKKLAVPLEAMAGQEERLALSMEKQRRIHSRCPIVKGRRVVKEESQVRLTSLGREIAQYRRQMKSIQAEWGKDLKRLRNYEQQWLRLQGKDFVYQIDVELDQIMGFFRISLVNLSCWFLRECLGRSSMSLSKLLHTILLMPAEIELTKEVRRVKLRRNPKDPEGMKKLEPALERLNELRIQHLDQKRIEFVLG